MPNPGPVNEIFAGSLQTLNYKGDIKTIPKKLYGKLQKKPSVLNMFFIMKWFQTIIILVI